MKTNVLILASMLVQTVATVFAQDYPSTLTDELTGSPLSSQTKKLVICIHGWNPTGIPKGHEYKGGEWRKLVLALGGSLHGTDWQLVLYHWENDANTGPIGLASVEHATVAANLAAAHGAHLSEQLSGPAGLAPNVRQVHFIAHSAGAWMARNAAFWLLRWNPYVTVQVTLLDPFVPGSVPEPWTPVTTLDVKAIGSLAQDLNQDRIYRLENYHGDSKILDPALLGGINTFAWRIGTDVNQVVSYASITPPLSCYETHNGPIQFYADTVVASVAGAAPSDCLLYASSAQPNSYQYSDYGWFDSLFYESPFLPQIVTQPQGPATPVTGGTSVTLSVTGRSPQPLSYQWFYAGQPIASANGASYSFTASLQNTLDAYVVEVRNVYGAVFSDAAYVTFQQSPGGSGTLPPPALVGPGSQDPSGSPVVTLTPTFQWQAVAGADGYGLYIRDLTTGQLVFNSETDVGAPLQGTSYVLPSSKQLQDSGRYRWNMSAHNSAGYGTPNATRFYFTVSLPPQTASVAVTANPASGGWMLGSGNYPVGSQQTISATASPNWLFTGWSDGNTDNPRFVTVPAGGATYTADFSQQAPPAAKPTVATDPASAPGGSTATLNGTVNPNGADTQVYFQYGTDANLGGAQSTSLQPVGRGNSSLPVSAIVSVSPNTKYYVALVARNTVGTTYGPTIPFTTGPTTVEIDLQVSATVDFGTSVPVGSSQSQVLTISNPSWSTGPLVGNVAAMSAPFTVVSGGGSFTLAPGQVRLVVIQFSPLDAQFHSNPLQITSNASNMPSNPFVVVVRGTGQNLTVGIEVNPTALTFDNVPPTGEAHAYIAIANPASSTGNLEVTGVSGLTPPLYAETGSLPMGIGPGTTNPSAVYVRFIPTSLGTFNQTLTITHNAGGPITIPVIGRTPVMQLAANPLSVNFGQVVVGGSALQGVTTWNDPSSTANITEQIHDLTSSPSGAFSIEAGQVLADLAPGQTNILTINFSPPSLGSFTGQLSLWHQDDPQHFIIVQLTGTGVADTTAPTVVISSPTTNSTYVTTSSSFNLGGAASDDVAVTNVTWANNRGGSGTANGTSSWSVYGISLQPGENVIAVNARDSGANTRSAVITVTYTPTDTTPPTLTISDPTAGQSFNASPIVLSGTATDPGSPSSGVVVVEFRVNGSPWQAANGTITWTASASLSPGTNLIEARCEDNAGTYSAHASVPVTYAPLTNAVSPLTITMSGDQAVLSWPTNLTGYVLQTTASLGSLANWQTVPGTPPVVQEGYSVMLAAINTQQFFRLATGPAPSVSWAKRYAGSVGEGGGDVRQMPDGEYLAWGWTESFGAGSSDMWLVRLDSAGNVLRQQSFGGSGREEISKLLLTSDAGYAAIGLSGSFGASQHAPLVLKFDVTGAIQWQKTYLYHGRDWGNDVEQTQDGGYLIVGQTDPCACGGPTQATVTKLSATGDIQWAKMFSPETGFGWAQTTSDGGYIAVGWITATAGDQDALVVKLDSNGNIQWQETYGGSADDVARVVLLAPDGGYLLCGTTSSFGAGGNDVWLLKLDAKGTVLWQKTYGSSGDDQVWSADSTSDGGYVIGAHTKSFGFTTRQTWVLKVDASGNVIWQRSYNTGSPSQAAHAVHQTADAGYIVSSFSDPGCPLCSPPLKPQYCAVLKINADGSVSGTCPGDVGFPTTATVAQAAAVAGQASLSLSAYPVSATVTSVQVADTTASTQSLCGP